MPKIGLKSFRPPGYTGKGDQHLSKIHRDLTKMLKKIQKTHHLVNLDLPSRAFDQIAGVLVEFAEDLHNDLGIWRSYEQYNQEFFETPLPLTLEPDELVDARELARCRIHHLLWVLFPEFDPGLILSPEDDELYIISELVSDFLIERFEEVPRDSGIKKFLNEPNQFGWDVKRKLIWLGQGSYMFRYFFGNYMQEQGGRLEISTIDDFICQETTAWSGLGVIDILAATLDITEEQRHDLQSWYERHLAVFRIVSTNPKDGTMSIVNLINDKPYKVRVGDQVRQFKTRMFVSGSLVPWNGEWYWSGQQSTYSRLSKKDIQQVKYDFTTRMSGIAYRYCDDLAEEARKMLKTHYEEFLKYHGSDLILYPDGLALAEDFEEQIRSFTESREQQLPSKSGEKRPAANEEASMDFLDQFLEMENGVAVYFNPDEGQEIMTEFNDVLNGLKKRGYDLNEDEKDSIRGFIFSDAISPGFVKRVVQEYDYESIASAFFIEDPEDDLFLEYLLRRYKGHFYRKRYPALSIIP